MLDIYQSAIIITAIFFTGFGVFAIWNNKKDIQVRLFALLSIAFAIWSYSWFGLLSISESPNTALFFARLLNFGATFIPIFFLHWVFVSTNEEKRNHLLIILGYLVTFVFAVFSFTDLYIPGVRSISIFPYWPIAGVLYTYFIIIGYIGFIITGLILLINGFIKSNGEKRKRIVFLFIGSFLGFIGGGINFPMMFGYVIPQPYDLIGVFMLMASPFMFSYAAIHYKLFDIKNVSIQLYSGALNIVFIINVLLAKSFSGIFINSLLLIFTIWFTIILIRSVKKEISQREALVIANFNQENLIHIINHQIKGYLAKSRSIFSELLENPFYGPVTDKSKVMMLEGLKSLTEGVAFTEQILNTANIESTAMQYKMGKIDIVNIVNEVISSYRDNNPKPELEIIFNKPDEIININGDFIQIKETIKNLIDNSIRYTIKGNIDIKIIKGNNTVLISVKDTGVGITEEDRIKLFTKGGRGKDSLKINVNSTGYGLFFVKKVIEAHNGKVWVESEGKNKGSNFFIELPLYSLKSVISNK